MTMRMMRLVVADVSSVFLSLFIAALLSTMTMTAVVVVNAQEGASAPGVHYTCALSALQLDSEQLVTLEHVKNVAEGTFSMRLTYTGGIAWVAIGVNQEGSTKMVPSTAVIGRIEYDVDGTSYTA